MAPKAIAPYATPAPGTGGGGGASQLSDLSDVSSSTKTAGNILVADGSDFASVAVSGDITLSGAGAAAIASGVIVDADVNAAAAIAWSKLDKTGAVASDVGAATASEVWQTIYTDGTGLTPTDTNTVPYTGTGIEVGMGVRCTYDDGGGADVYYGIVSAVSASTSFDTYLAIFNASYAVTKIEVCNASALTEILLHAPGLYAGAAHDDIFTDWGTPVVAGKAFAVGRVYAKHGTDDSAATTTEPAYNVNIGGTSNNIFSANVELTTSFADATGAPSFTHYTAAAGEVIDVKIAQATGGTPGNDATNLAILVVGVPL